MTKNVLCIVVLFSAMLVATSASSQEVAQDVTDDFAIGETPREEMLSRIDCIIIHVASHIVEVIQLQPYVKRWYEAGTASIKSIGNGDISFGEEGYVWKVALNPSWYPTKDMLEEAKKEKKKLPRPIGPGEENNPLGIGKAYFGFNGIPSVLGMHDTNLPESIGKSESQGCTRMFRNNMLEVIYILLEQNGFDAYALFAEAQVNPKKTIVKTLADQPLVVHLND